MALFQSSSCTQTGYKTEHNQQYAPYCHKIESYNDVLCWEEDMLLDLNLNGSSEMVHRRPMHMSHQEKSRNLISPRTVPVKPSHLHLCPSPSFLSSQVPKEWAEICEIDCLKREVLMCDRNRVYQNRTAMDTNAIHNKTQASTTDQLYYSDGEMCLTPPLSPTTPPFQASRSAVEDSPSRGVWPHEEELTPPPSPFSSSPPYPSSFRVAPSQYKLTQLDREQNREQPSTAPRTNPSSAHQALRRPEDPSRRPDLFPSSPTAISSLLRPDPSPAKSLRNSLNMGGSDPVGRKPLPSLDSQPPADCPPRRAESVPSRVPPEQAELRTAFEEMVRGRRDVARAWIRTRMAEASGGG